MNIVQVFPSKKAIESLRKQYPIGARIRLIEMNDVQAVEPGMTGTVEMVDDAGSIHIKWDNGRGLALIPGEDRFKVLSRPEEKQEEGMRMI